MAQDQACTCSGLPAGDRTGDDPGVAGNAWSHGCNGGRALRGARDRGRHDPSCAFPRRALHIFVGTVLVPVALLKTFSTGYRFVRYYAGNEAYVRKGAPPVILRLAGPLVIVLTVAVFATGIAAAVAGPGTWLLEAHKASFILWFVVTTVHVLGHILETAALGSLTCAVQPDTPFQQQTCAYCCCSRPFFSASCWLSRRGTGATPGTTPVVRRRYVVRRSLRSRKPDASIDREALPMPGRSGTGTWPSRLPDFGVVNGPFRPGIDVRLRAGFPFRTKLPRAGSQCECRGRRDGGGAVQEHRQHVMHWDKPGVDSSGGHGRFAVSRGGAGRGHCLRRRSRRHIDDDPPTTQEPPETNTTAR